MEGPALNLASTFPSPLPSQVRRCMAYSLHEYASLLGTTYAEQSLLPAFERYLGDLEEVRIGALATLSKFIPHLDEACRLQAPQVPKGPGPQYID